MDLPELRSATVSEIDRARADLDRLREETAASKERLATALQAVEDVFEGGVELLVRTDTGFLDLGERFVELIRSVLTVGEVADQARTLALTVVSGSSRQMNLIAELVKQVEELRAEADRRD